MTSPNLNENLPQKSQIDNCRPVGPLGLFKDLGCLVV